MSSSDSEESSESEEEPTTVKKEKVEPAKKQETVKKMEKAKSEHVVRWIKELGESRLKYRFSDTLEEEIEGNLLEYRKTIIDLIPEKLQKKLKDEDEKVQQLLDINTKGEALMRKLEAKAGRTSMLDVFSDVVSVFSYLKLELFSTTSGLGEGITKSIRKLIGTLKEWQLHSIVIVECKQLSHRIMYSILP